MKVIIVGGGWAGCAAALTVVKKGAEAVLIERTDMLLGTGLVGGIFRNNGRFTAAEEMIAMSGGELFHLMDQTALHKDVDFPGHRHASLYNVARMEPVVKRFLLRQGVRIQSNTRIVNAEMDGNRIKSVLAKQEKEELYFAGDAFIDTTGTAGPPANCNKYGNGCAMCILRCHSFGGRVSLAAKAGVREISGEKNGRIGAMSGSCKLMKESLDPAIVDELNTKGVSVVPIPKSKIIRGKLALKCCQQYALSDFEENIVLLDTGHAKLMTPFFPLEALREIPGLENARYEDPYAGGIGNSIRYIGMSPRDNALKVEGVENLFCAGEKAGLMVGHTEAICTGTLAGYNAVRYIKKEKPLILPTTLAVGELISYVRTQMIDEGIRSLKYTFSGSVFFKRMGERGLYSIDIEEIEKRVDSAGMSGIFS
ncbi:MAG: FAD-dependent oxidoreductase [Deltaproteobacteria bacterium]|nr:FAD-dependent oxidoreductase [Deltaproteobacteria bacterium]MBW2016686.1 FAD-dependent oxidoreductase [Deltaproteobacteria bacterium]